MLKGGMLLAAMDSRRPTRDVDLAARDLQNDLEALRQVVANILAVEVDDGLRFDRVPTRAAPIREAEQYGGVRIVVTSRLSSARMQFGVDINIGDPVVPHPGWITLPRLLGGGLHVLGYPIEMVLAEKLVTAVQLGSSNTRWRDFVDITRLTKLHAVDGNAIATAVHRVAEHRDVNLTPLMPQRDDYATTAQTKWNGWRRRLGMESDTPETFADVLDAAIRFIDPVVTDEATGLMWHPVTGSWLRSDQRHAARLPVVE